MENNKTSSKSGLADLFRFRLDTKSLVTIALLVAMEVVLSRFLSINAWNIKIGFSFLPIVIGAMLYGPVGGALVAALGDFLGATLFPIGAYFPGFTLTAFLTGFVFGLFLYKDHSLPRIAGAVLFNQCVLSLCLNTLWISILYGAPYQATLISRLPQTAILIVVEMVVIAAVAKMMPRFKNMVAAGA